MEGRCLRSKWERATLWYDAGGRCGICGAVLEGRPWEADHIVPWQKRRRTRAVEMQALCRDCNRRKGTMTLRAHQEQLDRNFREVVAGNRPCPKRVMADVCCGGGKSPLAGISAHYTIKKLHVADKLSWWVPNGALKTQGADSLKPDEFISKYYGLHLKIYENANEENPSKGGDGYAGTYHALVADWKAAKGDPLKMMHVREAMKHRYWGVFDEGHHLAKGSPFALAVEAYIPYLAGFTWMSGQMGRADRSKISQLLYGPDGFPITQTTNEEWWISYRVRQAMLEEAIIQVHFTFADASAEWYENGEAKEAEELGEDRAALFTALSTELSATLQGQAIRHWRDYRKVYPGAKVLVVCANVSQARRQKALYEKSGGDDGAIATYADDDANDVLDAFRKGTLYQGRKLFVIFTVAKAYEGLDVKSITHLVCLTHIRSRYWIEQMIARCWRYDPEGGPYGGQRGFVWAPGDKPLKECIKHIEQEQQEAARQRREEEEEGREGGEFQPPPIIVPVGSVPRHGGASSFGEGSMTPEEALYYEDIGKRAGLSHLPPMEIKRLLQAAGAPTTAPFPESPRPPAGGSISPTQELNKLKSSLNELVGQIARDKVKLPPGRERSEAVGQFKKGLNEWLFAHYGSREAMTPEQLRDAMQKVRKAYDY